MDKPRRLNAIPTALSLTCSAKYSSYSLSEQNCQAIATIEAPDPFYDPSSRASVDIVVVIDKSDSMSGKKINLVKKTLLVVIDQCKFVHEVTGVFFFVFAVSPIVFAN